MNDAIPNKKINRFVLDEIRIAAASALETNVSEPAITRDALVKFMGYGNAPVPGPVQDAMERYFAEFASFDEQRAGLVIEREVLLNDCGFTCRRLSFDTGPIITRGITGSAAFVVFAATAGPAIDRLSKRAARDGDLLLSYTIDSAGSVIVEELADRIERIVGSVSLEHSLGVTRRYSPGYCGWNVAEQRRLFSLFPPSFCGIELTESSLMVPLKSVSGIIGLGEEARRKPYECANCDKKDCVMKKRMNKKNTLRSEDSQGAGDGTNLD